MSQVNFTLSSNAHVHFTIACIIDEAIKDVKNAYPSIYSKDDVHLLLINLGKKLSEIKIEETTAVGLTPDDVITCMNEDMSMEDYYEVETDSASFRMDRDNCVYLEEVDTNFDTRTFISELKSNLQSYLEVKRDALNTINNESVNA